MSLLWLFFYINVTRILCRFFTNFLKCTLLYIYIRSHDNKGRRASWGGCLLIGDDGGALEVRRSGRGLDRKKWEYLLGTQPCSCIWIIGQRAPLQTGHGRSQGRKAERSKLTLQLGDFPCLNVIQSDQTWGQIRFSCQRWRYTTVGLLLKQSTLCWKSISPQSSCQQMPVGRQGDKTCLVLFISINGARKYSQKNCHQERDPNATQMGKGNCFLYRKLLLLVLMDGIRKNNDYYCNLAQIIRESSYMSQCPSLNEWNLLPNLGLKNVTCGRHMRVCFSPWILLKNITTTWGIVKKKNSREWAAVCNSFI